MSSHVAVVIMSVQKTHSCSGASACIHLSGSPCHCCVFNAFKRGLISNVIACQEQTPSSRGVRRGSGAHGQQQSDGTLTAWDVFILHLYCWFNRKERKKKCAFLIQIENYFDKNTKMTLILFFFFSQQHDLIFRSCGITGLVRTFCKMTKKTRVFLHIFFFKKARKQRACVGRTEADGCKKRKTGNRGFLLQQPYRRSEEENVQQGDEILLVFQHVRLWEGLVTIQKT